MTGWNLVKFIHPKCYPGYATVIRVQANLRSQCSTFLMQFRSLSVPSLALALIWSFRLNIRYCCPVKTSPVWPTTNLLFAKAVVQCTRSVTHYTDFKCTISGSDNKFDRSHRYSQTIQVSISIRYTSASITITVLSISISCTLSHLVISVSDAVSIPILLYHCKYQAFFAAFVTENDRLLHTDTVIIYIF